MRGAMGDCECPVLLAQFPRLAAEGLPRNRRWSEAAGINLGIQICRA